MWRMDALPCCANPRSGINLALLLVFGTLLGAASAATAAGEASSPKGAVKAFYEAVARGDAAAVRRILLVDNDPDQQFVAAYADLILSARHLADAAKQKYPGTADAFTQGTILPEDAAKIDSAVVAINGQNATVRLAGRDQPLKLRSQGGSWRVVIVSEEPDPTGAHRANQLALLKGLTDAMNQSAEEIAADKYPTVQEAENAVKDRLGAIQAKALQHEPPASHPATQP